jgi:pyruvate-ferredoxin/flavodoxin oxidoreductase
MKTKIEHVTWDGNQAVAEVAYRLNEVVVIYPITPSSPMGEWADLWASEGRLNLWGSVPTVMEMQSEAGAAGAAHGALQTGSLTTTFTASQGLLLMIPNMYKIAGELTPTVFHVAARSVATHALSIFGDHSDVMATRATGFAMLCSNSVQEAQDFSLIAHMASFESRLPFLHFFDGFRTSHELAQVVPLSDDDMRALLKPEWLSQHRARALSPDHPVLRGSAQNPDVFFQARETVNLFELSGPEITQRAMDQFAARTGRHYKIFEYVGAPDAERLVVMMGSGAETAEETVRALTARGEKIGLLKVRLFRPFDAGRFYHAIPETVRAIAVLDRTKEPGSAGEPLYLDCVAALHSGLAYAKKKGTPPAIVGGRYGLSSKEFTPAMAKAVFDHLKVATPKASFSVGITDDVTHSSLAVDPSFSIESPKCVRAIFYGLGSDGTVGANKNSIKIIDEYAGLQAQGYFVYDSRKAGAVTVSHLRFGPDPIRAPYLIEQAQFVACHQWPFIDHPNLLKPLMPGGTFLLNAPCGPEEVWKKLPRPVQQTLLDKKARLFVIDAYKVARETGLGAHINVIMQTCFFAISGVLPKDEAIHAIEESIRKTYQSKGDEVVQLNLKAVAGTLARLSEVKLPATLDGGVEPPPMVPPQAPEFVRRVLGPIMEGRGDDLPVSALPIDGTFPTGTAQWDKRNLTLEIPVWDPAVCIQCGKCTLVCPHSVIRMKIYPPEALAGAPANFLSRDAMDRDWKGSRYTLQVSAEDCTGCALCVDVCPAKNKSEARLKAINMQPRAADPREERAAWEFFLKLPDVDRRKIQPGSVRSQQLQRPLFEFPSACAGCGETPYLKLISQLFGDRMIVANATGCSSIYGGNLPTTPWAFNEAGRGPAWSNSLFEDTAEFGLGFRLSLDHQKVMAVDLLRRLEGSLGSERVNALIQASQKDEAGIYEQRQRVAELKEALKSLKNEEARQLESVADSLVKKSVWIVGGDGWAYDIGYGGLDHVLASGRDVNMLVLDTEVYSNTGGQMSKATPRAAVAKFAAGGKPNAKKDLGLMAMSYGTAYVACVAMGARDEHTVRAFLEAEAYEGPSIVIAYSHCIAHGIATDSGLQQQKAAVDSGDWILYRYNPDLVRQGKNPLILDSPAAKIPLQDYLSRQNRFKMLTKSNPEAAKTLWRRAQESVQDRRRFYEYLAARSFAPASPLPAPQPQAPAAAPPSAPAPAASTPAAPSPPPSKGEGGR